MTKCLCKHSSTPTSRSTMSNPEPTVRWSEVEELLSMVQCAFQFKSKAVEVRTASTM